jgi:ComF family protein
MLKKLLKLFFPNNCLSCAEIMSSSENLLCTSCRHNLPLTNNAHSHTNEGFKKFYGRIPLEHVSSMFFYYKKGIVQQLIHNLKYKNHQEIGSMLGHWYASDLKRIKAIENIDYIVPVPLHRKRLKERGYNQVDTFCKAIANDLGKPFESKILYRKEYATSQSKKDLMHRNTVTEKTFEIRYTEIHHGKHFLLIDDVLTTGATLEACGKEILKIPNAKLSIVTIAMSQS